MPGQRDGAKQSPLRFIKGGLTSEIVWKGIRIVAAPKEAKPFVPEAFAFEEDTFLVMSADPTVRDPRRPLIRIMSDLIEAQPRLPGTVLVQGTSPVRLLAIIHDFSEDPSWKEDWVKEASVGIFEAAARLNLRSVALPLLGTVHGSLDRQRAMQFLAQGVRSRPLHELLSLWLIVPAGKARTDLDLLKSYL
jgi:hypothetical protein